MEKVFVVKRVAEKLWATENAIDGAIGQASTLMADMMTARQELKLSAGVGDEAVGKVIDAMKALSEARQAMIAAHQGLEEVRQRTGIRIKMDGLKLPTLQNDEQVEARRVV